MKIRRRIASSVLAFTMLLSISIAPVNAAVTDYIGEKDGKVFAYNLNDLVDAAINKSIGLDAPLYDHFLEAELVSVYDDVKGYVSIDDVIDELIQAKLFGTEFDLNDFTENKAEAIDAPAGDIYLVNPDGSEELKEEEVEELEVIEISAINANYVTVAITAPEEDMLAQEVEVKNGAGTVVPVKPLDIAAGDKTAEFEFVTAVKAVDLKGVWTVNGQSYDLDLFNNLSDFLAAADQLELNAALTALEIENVKSANMPAYFTAQQAVTKSAEELTVADVQKLVDDVNEAAVEAGNEADIVKAVTDAKTAGNAITLLQALQNKAFVRVNPDWVTTATNGYMDKIVGTETTIAAIQALIDAGNDAIIKTSPTTTGIDKAKLNETLALVNAWATVDKDGKITDATIKTYPGLIEIQLAVADVVAATTPTALKNKLTVLAGLDKTNLDMKNYVDANGKAYITALGALADTAKDTTTQIAGVITSTNTTEAGKLVTAVNTAATGTDADALFKALNDLGLKQVAASNKAKYLADKADFATESAAGKTKVDVQKQVDKSNVAAITSATDADNLLEALKVLELKNVVDANKDAYLADAGSTIKTDATTIDAALKAINDNVSVTALVKVIKESTDVTETEEALVALANLGKVANFLDIPKADRTFVAEELVAIVDRADVDSDTKINTAVGTVKTTITNALTAVNALTNASNEAAVITALENVKVFDDLSAIAKKDIANKFIEEVLEVLEDTKTPNFKSYTELSNFIAGL